MALGLTLTATIFAADTVFVISPAFSVLYIVPLLILANGGATHLVSRWAAICGALSIAAFLLGLPLSFGPMALPNLGIGLIAIAMTAQQLTHAERLRRRLSADERRYRGVFNSLAVAIWECDLRPVEAAIADLHTRGVRDLRSHLAGHPEFAADLRRRVFITDVNQTALDMMGVADKQALLRRLSDFLPEGDQTFAACIAAVAERQPLFQAQTRVRTTNGEELDVIVAFGLGSAAPLDRVVVSFVNVSEQNRLARLIAANRDQLARAQQSAALGQMAASIAHEIEQPLTAIQTSLGAAARWLHREPIDTREVAASIETGLEGTHRAMEVIRRIRALIIGSAEPETSTLGVDTLVQESTLLLQNDIDESGTRLVQQLHAQAIVRADRILLQQVLVNLLRNAMQAMADLPRDERRIVIDTALADGGIRLTITDSGPGWPDEILTEAFAAFRTTKPKGMGIGLSVCRTIVEAHGGTIRLRNAAPRGAAVDINLPTNETATDAVSLRSDLQTQIRDGTARTR